MVGVRARHIVDRWSPGRRIGTLSNQTSRGSAGCAGIRRPSRRSRETCEVSIVPLETERLRLRALEKHDIDDVFAILGDDVTTANV